MSSPLKSFEMKKLKTWIFILTPFSVNSAHSLALLINIIFFHALSPFHTVTFIPTHIIYFSHVYTHMQSVLAFCWVYVLFSSGAWPLWLAPVNVCGSVKLLLLYPQPVPFYISSDILKTKAPGCTFVIQWNICINIWHYSDLQLKCTRGFWILLKDQIVTTWQC